MRPLGRRRRIAGPTGLVAAVLLLGLAGCGATESAGSSEAAPVAAVTTAAPVEPAAPQPTAIVEPGPTSAAEGPLAFSHQKVGGGTIDFAALAGQPVALWFWAPY